LTALTFGAHTGEVKRSRKRHPAHPERFTAHAITDILPRLQFRGFGCTFAVGLAGGRRHKEWQEQEAFTDRWAEQSRHNPAAASVKGDHMTFMEWTKDYSVGVAIFDDEHKKLIAIINQLHDAVADGIDKADLQRVCDSLVEYTLMHFRHEEMYFDDWAYPDAATHIAVHANLRQRVFGYRKQIQAKDSEALAGELAAFLRDWLYRHILVEDRKYGEFLCNKGLR
jgi:hemerythrin